MNIEDRIAVGIPVWRKMVEDAGGQWQGVQMSFPCASDPYPDAPEPMVLFLAPFRSNPIALSIDQMTEENVKEKLGIKSVVKKTHKVDFTHVQMHLNEMRASALDLLDMIDKIAEEIKNV